MTYKYTVNDMVESSWNLGKKTWSVESVESAICERPRCGLAWSAPSVRSLTTPFCRRDPRAIEVVGRLVSLARVCMLSLIVDNTDIFFFGIHRECVVMKSLECSVRSWGNCMLKVTKSASLSKQHVVSCYFLGFGTATNTRKIKFSLSGSCLVWELSRRRRDELEWVGRENRNHNGFWTCPCETVRPWDMFIIVSYLSSILYLQYW